MNTDTLEQTANEALKQLIEASTTAAEWTAQQLPEVIEQLILWKMVESLLWFTASITLMAVGLYILYKFIKKCKEVDNFIDDEVLPIISVFVSVGIIISIVASIAMIDFDWLQIIIAPKLYLIEYAANLIK